MSSYNDGEHMPLYWDGEPAYQVIRGHVTVEEANAAMAINGVAPAASVIHKYARWCFAKRGRRDDGIERVLHTQHEPGRGAFKVTIAHDTGRGL